MRLRRDRQPFRQRGGQPAPGRRTRDGRRLIDAGISLAEFNREFAASLGSEEVETLAGALLEAFGELPAAGAAIDLGGLGFTVDGVEHNRITRVFVERLPEPEVPAETAGNAGEVTAVRPGGSSRGATRAG